MRQTEVGKWSKYRRQLKGSYENNLSGSGDSRRKQGGLRHHGNHPILLLLKYSVCLLKIQITSILTTMFL